MNIGPEGWIAWSGGTCPVAANTRVDVQLRAREEAGHSPLEGLWARDLDWRYSGATGDSGDIVAYRKAQP